MDSPGSGNGLVINACEQNNEPSDSILGGEFLQETSDYQLLKKDSVQGQSVT
jgi:hypothetical protein